MLLAIVIAGLALTFWPDSPPPKPGSESAPIETPEPVAAAKPDDAAKRFRPLIGNWLREDGGYRLEIGSAESDGQLQATYFNPSAIRVSLATATNDANTLKLRVELNDVGYPGCVYSLVHDRVNDRLVGTYFQAAMGETYEIMFVRAQ